MAIVVASGSAVSVSANTTTAEQVSGTYQITGAGVFTLVAKASATGLNTSCRIGGVDLVSDSVIPYTGTAGTVSTGDNIMAAQVLSGGKAELKFRNTTGGTITVDYMLYWDALPSR